MGLHIYPVTIKQISPPIHGLLARPDKVDRTLPTLIYYHGLSGTRNQAFQERYMELAEALMDLGCNLLAVDLRGHGERRADRQMPAVECFIKLLSDRKNNPFDGALEDAKRTVDFAIERKIAHPSHIGVIGLSWGGMHVLYALKAERRIRCGVALLPVCKIASLQEFRPFKDNALIQQYEPLTFATGIAPKPLLIVSGEKDKRADPAFTAEYYQQLMPEYEKLNKQDRLAYAMLLDASHAYDSRMTDMTIGWLKEYLMPEDEKPSIV
ncbi:MAG: alpha/beta fold hydrolase [bacterium]|nr:alpha/beta fold hydrolase [bacterium]